MALYKKLKKHPLIFKRTTGLDLAEFHRLIQKLSPIWHKKQAKKKKSGRPHGIKTLENQLLCLLVYYRTYTSQLFISFFFKVDTSTICRTMKALEPLLAKVTAIKKEKKLTEKELQEILIDCTEQPTQRPKKNQKKYYSGKKKKHTLKNEIQMNSQGRIISVSKSAPGSVHDMRLRRSQKKLPKKSTIIADSGYQGLQKTHRKAEIYKKARRGHPLKAIDRAYNKVHSAIRIPIEHKINEIKIFRILKDTFRNPLGSHSIKWYIISGLVNLKNSFMS